MNNGVPDDALKLIEALKPLVIVSDSNRWFVLRSCRLLETATYDVFIGHCPVLG